MVKKPTTDSGTLIDHVYVSQEMTVTTDVTDCYCARSQSISQHVDTGQLNIPP